MKYIRINKYRSKIEASNCVINIIEGLHDRYGREVTAIQVSPDNYAGEPYNRRYGYYNTRVVTMKHKRKA